MYSFNFPRTPAPSLMFWATSWQASRAGICRQENPPRVHHRTPHCQWLDAEACEFKSGGGLGWEEPSELLEREGSDSFHCPSRNFTIWRSTACSLDGAGSPGAAGSDFSPVINGEQSPGALARKTALVKLLYRPAERWPACRRCTRAAC